MVPGRISIGMSDEVPGRAFGERSGRMSGGVLERASSRRLLIGFPEGCLVGESDRMSGG